MNTSFALMLCLLLYSDPVPNAAPQKIEPDTNVPATSAASSLEAAPASSENFFASKSTLEELVKLMTGSFSSATQHAMDEKNYFDIRLHMAPIWAAGSSIDKGFWLYVEQAIATDLEHPYRQRIYRVFTETVTGADGKPLQVFKSEVYLLPGKPEDALKFAGAWREPARLDSLKPEQLTLKDGCTVVLTRTAPVTFDGATVGKGCPSERAGAKYATAEVHVSPTGLKTWDRGFNDKDEQVWGATEGPYIFDRVDQAP